MKYKGYELLKAIEDGEIEEGTEIFVTTSLDGRYTNTSRAYIGHNDIYWKDTNKQLPAYAFITGEFELIEDEIDIDSIIELEEFELDQFVTMDKNERFDRTMIEYSKINELVQAVKQINKEVKELETLNIVVSEENIDKAIKTAIEQLKEDK